MALPKSDMIAMLDPVTDFGGLPTITNLRKTQQTMADHQAQKNALQMSCKKLEQKKWYHTLAIQSVIALLSGGFVALLLYAFNPPITQKKSGDSLTSEKQDWRKVLA